MDDLGTYATNTWCPGCGNFGILGAFKEAVHELEAGGLDRKQMVVVCGIGQHGKTFDYLNISGFYALHGRGSATAQGIKLANPDLNVVSFGGDGDSFGEGLEHVLFAAKRNADISLFVHDNGVYGLTTGQYTPTSQKGYRGPSTPTGTVEEPINAMALLLQAGATFVARGFPGRRQHLRDLMVRAVRHKGFAFVDVLQPCVTFNNTWERYNTLVEPFEEVPQTLEEAIALTYRTDKLPIGVFYEKQLPPFHEALLGERNPVRDHRPREARLQAISAFVGG